MAIWRAWYDLEPREDERADVLAAFQLLPHLDKEVSLRDAVRMIRDAWTPLTKAERARRKEEQRRKRNQRMNMQALAAAALQGAKDGK